MLTSSSLFSVVGSTGAGKSTVSLHYLGLHGRSGYAILFIYAILLQFINTAISKDVMTVCHSLESSIAEVKSAKCTSPWNLSGRKIIFVEIPAFNHSDLAMQMKIPHLIRKWLTQISYVLLYFILMRFLWK